MKVETRYFTLGDGRDILLRAPVNSDAQSLIEFHKRVSDETHYLTGYGDEIRDTVEHERKFIDGLNDSERDFMICAFYDGDLIGNVSVCCVSNKFKRKHRAEIAISVVKDFWNFGIGSKLMEDAITQAKDNGFEQIELGVFADNDRAIKLYGRYGFAETGRIPRAYHLYDDSYIDELEMVKLLN